MRTGMSREKRTICGVAETWSRSPTGKDDVHVKDSSISCKRTCRIMPESSSEACQQAILSVQKSLPKYAQKSSEACQQVFQSVQKSIPKHARQSSKVCQKALRSVQNVLPKYAKKSSEAWKKVFRSISKFLQKYARRCSELRTRPPDYPLRNIEMNLWRWVRSIPSVALYSQRMTSAQDHSS